MKGNVKDMKIKLSFVNGGKNFDIPKMTVKRQEELMEEMVRIEKETEKIEDKEKQQRIYNREFNKYLVLKTLQIVDSSVSVDDIESMHPDDFVRIFGFIWKEGKELDEKDDNKSFR